MLRILNPWPRLDLPIVACHGSPSNVATTEIGNGPASVGQIGGGWASPVSFVTASAVASLRDPSRKKLWAGSEKVTAAPGTGRPLSASVTLTFADAVRPMLFTASPPSTMVIILIPI